MQFVSVRVISGDVPRLADFYEQATGLDARRPAEQFAEFAGPSGKLAIGDVRTMPFRESEPGRTTILEFLVEDVDREYERLTRLAVVPEIVQPPTTMPWGNRSLLFRDPDGNLVNFFTPLTEDARARLAH